MSTKFRNEEHEKNFYALLSKMEVNEKDVYRIALAYLIALDDVCSYHINEMYDFEDRCINPTAIEKPWQTGTSLKTTLLAFNLYTGHTAWCPDEYVNICTPSDIFVSEYAEYYWEAIKLRYPEITLNIIGFGETFKNFIGGTQHGKK